MKTVIFLALGATALYLVAKRNNINSLQDLKDLMQPQLDKLMEALGTTNRRETVNS